MRWTVAGAIFVCLATLGALVAPSLTVAAIAGVVGILVFFAKPKFAAGASIVLILFGSALPTATGIDMLGYLDEALVMLSLTAFTCLRLMKHRNVRALPGQWWIALYLLIGVASGIARDVPFILAAQSSFLMLKGFIFAFAIAQLDWDAKDIRKLVKPAVWVIVLTLVMCLINLAIPAQWFSTFGRASKLDFRLGLPSLMGPFDHPMALGQFMALATVAIVAYRANIGKSGLSTALLIGTFVGALLSFRRKAIVAMIVAGTSAMMLTPGRKVGTAMGIVFVAPILLLAGWDSLSSIIGFTYEEYFGNVEETARTLLYRDSFLLAAAAFPLGVGFGRFGSFLASQQYSPEYIALGYPSIYRMGIGENSGFLSDTFWPAILGESGFLGLIAFTIGLVVLAKHGKKLASSDQDPYVRWIGIVSVAWFVEFVVESIAAPVFSTPPMFVLCFGAAGIVVSLAAQQGGKASLEGADDASTRRGLVTSGSARLSKAYRRL